MPCVYCGCPILCVYRTSSISCIRRMSDILRLSDKQHLMYTADVRYFAFIGQAAPHVYGGCPILCGYRTSSTSCIRQMSDTLRLSDKQHLMYTADVRYFAVIGQAASAAQGEQQRLIVGKPQRRTRPKFRRVLLYYYYQFTIRISAVRRSLCRCCSRPDLRPYLDGRSGRCRRFRCRS